MDNPDIILIFDERIPNEFFEDFESSIKSDGLNLKVESREPTGAMACSAWFILPAIAACICKSYFDGFLKEMGKDHYQKFKEGLANLTTKVMTTPRIEPTLIGTQGKVSSNNPFSLAFSIYADTENGYTFKLLIPKPVSGCEYRLITNRFIEFLADYHLGLETLETIGCALQSARAPSGIIFVHYNAEKDAIEWLDEKDYR